MSTTEIANELNANRWYQKKDGSPITAFQIHGRTNNYASIFSRNGSTVSLVGSSAMKISKNNNSTEIRKSSNQIKRLGDSVVDVSLLEKILMNEKNCKSACSIDKIVPHKPGLYCIRITDSKRLPAPFGDYLDERGHNIIYIGIASTSLKRRFVDQELRALGHGTFFRSIGAILGYRPIKGSLNDKLNKRNYKFSKVDETKIIEWINRNLSVNWVESEKDFSTFETVLLAKYKPLLNISKNPSALAELKKLRAKCVSIANCP